MIKVAIPLNPVVRQRLDEGMLLIVDTPIVEFADYIDDHTGGVVVCQVVVALWNRPTRKCAVVTVTASREVSSYRALGLIVAHLHARFRCCDAELLEDDVLDPCVVNMKGSGVS